MSHTTFEELHEKILKWLEEIPVGSKWIHYKDEKAEHPYKVLNVALEEASEEIVVIYRREDKPETFMWTRPVEGDKGWVSELEVNGKMVKRFKRV